MKKTLILILLSILALPVGAQDVNTYKKIVKELSSPKYQGRGYAFDGVKKAAKYLEKAFANEGADEVTLQSFAIDINTFPGKMKMSVDDRKLEPGVGFVLREYSPGAHGTYNLYYIDTLNYDSAKIFADLDKPQYKDAFVVCDFWFTYRHKDDFKRLQSKECPNGGLIYVWNTPLKFYKAYGEKVVDKPIIWVCSDFPADANSVTLDIDNQFLSGYETQNVIAKVKGRRSDSCYVFIAHYDHLGNLGRGLYYPGVNDNASGTAAIVTLAGYYSRLRPEFDIYCLAVSGEEAGLRGSTYFVEHPIFPLDRIKYLFDLDMIGDNNPVQYCEVSDEGLDGFNLMEQIAKQQVLFASLKRGELAANSDHWPFAQKGVPCIMFENQDGDVFPYYHTHLDDWDKVEWMTYVSVFSLVAEFIKQY